MSIDTGQIDVQNNDLGQPIGNDATGLKSVKGLTNIVVGQIYGKTLFKHIIEGLVIVAVCIWPELALWLPNKMIG